jgi:Fe-S cluster biosynthesis and repair protein YggX
MTRTVQCVKLGVEADGLDFPPMPGELGQKIFDNISKEAWQSWINQQTMIINENRLNLSDESSRKYLRQQLEYFLFAGQ